MLRRKDKVLTAIFIACAGLGYCWRTVELDDAQRADDANRLSYVPPVPADASIEDAVNLWFRRLPDDAFLVADVEGPVGVAVLRDVARVPRPERSRLSIRDVMRPLDDLPHLDANAPAPSVLEALVAHDAAIVTDCGKPVGVLTSEAVRGRLSREEALEPGRSVRR